MPEGGVQAGTVVGSALTDQAGAATAAAVAAADAAPAPGAPEAPEGEGKSEGSLVEYDFDFKLLSCHSLLEFLHLSWSLSQFHRSIIIVTLELYSK